LTPGLALPTARRLGTLPRVLRVTVRKRADFPSWSIECPQCFPIRDGYCHLNGFRYPLVHAHFSINPTARHCRQRIFSSPNVTVKKISESLDPSIKGTALGLTEDEVLLTWGNSGSPLCMNSHFVSKGMTICPLNRHPLLTAAYARGP
jgi:hypothetical protein